MRVALISYLVLWIASAALAAKLNCPEAHFWNGTSCKRCSGCPIGQGVKTNCSKTSDTICQDCLPDFDYSNSTGMEACKGCDQDSNCLPGNSNEIQKCNVTSPRVCDGCKEGSYFDPLVGKEGGLGLGLGLGLCVKCSPPCSENEVETQSCKTEHDRLCREVPSTTEKTSTERPTTPMDPNDTREFSTSSSPVNYTEKGDDKEPEKIEETDPPLPEKSWLWAIVAVVVVIIALPIVIVTAVKYSRQRPRVVIGNNEGTQLIQRRQPQSCGLDQPIKNIEMEGRSFIADFLNSKDSQDYWYFLRVAEKVGLAEKCRGFTSLRNPTEAFLTLYSEREGSTVRALVDALRECELTHFASEIEEKFASVQETEEFKAADMDESIV